MNLITGRREIIGSSGTSPSGVLFKHVGAMQRTSYRTGDEGWRLQNGWFDYTPPTNPAKIAELVDGADPNYWYKLKTPLSVNGINSIVRFVDFNGVQDFSAVDNCNQYVIDKLTGIAFSRVFNAAANWNTNIDNALTETRTIKGITYSDIFVMSLAEYVAIGGQFWNEPNWIDPSTTKTISSTPNAFFQLSTTYAAVSTNFYVIGANSQANYLGVRAKTNLDLAIRVFNVRNLIS